MARWLESVLKDVVFGWRQLVRHRIASAAAILSVGLGIGASMAAFRLIDAMFLRPLPVAHPEQLYRVTYQDLFEGKISETGGFNYPTFRALRAAVRDQAELMAIAPPFQTDVAFGSEQEIERASRQYVSGSMFADFDLKPALGRLFTQDDDATPGAAPYAVISYDYWTRRFGRDPSVIGRRFRSGTDILEIIGVAPKGFTGTSRGTFTDIFVPNMMNAGAIGSGTWNAYEVWVRPKPGAGLAQIRERLSAALHSSREEEVKSWAPERPKKDRDFYVAAPALLEPAGNGGPSRQRGFQRPMAILAVLVGLVLLIACANVANLMTAQAAARAREMALRVSIGAGRARLVQLVLVEGALIGVAASASGLAFSWWAAPFITARLNPPDDPARLPLNVDWRVTLFALALAVVVTMLFGLAPALRASSIQPASALKGGDHSRGRRQLMNGLIAAQVAFCCFVLFVAGLFISTFVKMANQPTGFSAARVLAVDSVGQKALPADTWYQAVQQVRSLPGVQSAAVAWFALMSNNAQTRFIWANGHLPDGTWSNSTWFLGVSQGWFETMKLDLLEGRDFRWDDTYPNVAVVNEKFARRYFGNESPVGRTFESAPGQKTGVRVSSRIIGVVRDARYEDMRLPIPATAYVPLRGGTRNTATFLVRTKSPDPLTLAPTLRRDLQARWPEIRVADIVTQDELVQSQMFGERLLAALSVFFAAVALILAGVGLYGILNHAVVQRDREFGIRVALGARTRNIVWNVIAEVFWMLTMGVAVGLGLGVAAASYVSAMLYHVRATDPTILSAPAITLLTAALIAALPPVFRAVRVDPSTLLRTE